MFVGPNNKVGKEVHFGAIWSSVGVEWIACMWSIKDGRFGAWKGFKHMLKSGHNEEDTLRRPSMCVASWFITREPTAWTKECMLQAVSSWFLQSNKCASYFIMKRSLFLKRSMCASCFIMKRSLFLKKRMCASCFEWFNLCFVLFIKTTCVVLYFSAPINKPSCKA